MVIVSLSWGLGCNGNGGGTEVATRVEATVGPEAKRSSTNNNGSSSSSSSTQPTPLLPLTSDTITVA